MTTDAFGDELEIDTNSDSIEELKKMFEDSDSEELENKSTGTYTSLDVVKFTINKDNILQYYDAESKSNIEYDSNTLKVILLSKSCFIQLYDKTSTKFYNSNEYSFLEDNTRIELFSFDNGKRVSRGLETVSE
ncbi:MAG: hypothetical protein QM535_21160 [Limnohabitans sp.]|nr:hypothetical protein [Limnohabitans sp.]